MTECRKCGKLVKQQLRGRRRQYCVKCASERKQENDLKRQRDKRKNKLTFLSKGDVRKIFDEYRGELHFEDYDVEPHINKITKNSTRLAKEQMKRFKKSKPGTPLAYIDDPHQKRPISRVEIYEMIDRRMNMILRILSKQGPKQKRIIPSSVRVSPKSR